MVCLDRERDIPAVQLRHRVLAGTGQLASQLSSDVVRYIGDTERIYNLKYNFDLTDVIMYLSIIPMLETDNVDL